jgi:hypothetical protein
MRTPSPLEGFRSDDVLNGLHGFQRDAVEHAFHRLYTAPDSTHRFLVADEVGLGKTLIARGILAKSIEHLRGQVRRIDVIYICSNLRIARQNINRLNPLRDITFANAERVTLLPLHLTSIESSPINFVAFTPGTSLDLKGNLGIQRERLLLYALLDQAWGIKGVAPLNVLQGGVADAARFRERARQFVHEETISAEVSASFAAALGRASELRTEFEELCQLFSRQRRSHPLELRRRRNALVGRLRGLLAQTCIGLLEPDLVILDEFQRFKSLLSGESEEAELARQLFTWSGNNARARVLLLSATPYKPYTLQHELAEENHYEDFIRTVGFLTAGADSGARLKGLLSRYRTEMLELETNGSGSLLQIKAEIESILRKVMSRTERLAAAGDANGMLRSQVDASLAVQAEDLRTYAAIHALSHELDVGDALEYWKSAAFPLNFMEGYQLRTKLLEAAREGYCSDSLAMAVTTAHAGSLPFERIEKYREVHIPNARLRALMKSLGEEGAFDVLWLLPSMPYYAPAGRLANARTSISKRLIFSAWNVVPRSVAALLSYELERRVFTADEAEPENTVNARAARRGLLRFSITEGRLVGLPVLTSMYPCIELARVCDPAEFASVHGPTASANNVLTWAEGQVARLLPNNVVYAAPGEAADEQWYWAAPLLIDAYAAPGATESWWASADLDLRWSASAEESSDEDHGDEGWRQHVEQARTVALARRWPEGKAPADLVRVLALMGLAAPSTAVLRSFERLFPNSSSDNAVRVAAAQVGWGFRSLFNRPESMAIVRRGDRSQPYWKAILRYAHEGCLSAVLDEYVHVLRDACGLVQADPEKSAADIASAALSALQVRTATLDADEFHIAESERRIHNRQHSMRSLFAMRFGADKTEDQEQVRRDSSVRDAFNSPFWPFVLATTSAGQEGLDFHWYCHRVVHWNVPSNPVDLEQREGRVHRFKGHAVRKNVAHVYATAALADGNGDFWTRLFELARASTNGDRGLLPYWLFPIAEGAWIERHVLLYPLSKDEIRYKSLQKSLGAYRMVFGQPRQDELLAYMLSKLDESKLAPLSQLLRIDLAPPVVDSKAR